MAMGSLETAQYKEPVKPDLFAHPTGSVQVQLIHATFDIGVNVQKNTAMQYFIKTQRLYINQMSFQ